MRESTTEDVDWDSNHWALIQSQSSQIEFDWFARDSENCLAALSSFGIGPSPTVVRESRERFNALLRVVEGLPEASLSIVEPWVTYKRTDTWEHYARLGLFAYDNGNVHGSSQHYERIAHPERPLSLLALNLPTELLVCVPLLPVVFGESPSIPFRIVPV